MGKMVWTLTQGPAKLTPFKIFSVLHFRAGSASPSVERPVFLLYHRVTLLLFWEHLEIHSSSGLNCLEFRERVLNTVNVPHSIGFPGSLIAVKKIFMSAIQLRICDITKMCALHRQVNWYTVSTDTIAHWNVFISQYNEICWPEIIAFIVLDLCDQMKCQGEEVST